VPVLEHDGRRLTQSGVILTWLAATWPLWPARRARAAGSCADAVRQSQFTSYYATPGPKASKGSDPAVLEFLRRPGAFGSSTNIWRATFPARRAADDRRLSLAGYQYYEGDRSTATLPHLLA
jgi:glutathione S-transferase